MVLLFFLCFFCLFIIYSEKDDAGLTGLVDTLTIQSYSSVG